MFRRWRFASVLVGSDVIYVFGGHRLWHGFAADNSEANRWESRDTLPTGGYLDDLWRFSFGTRQWLRTPVGC